MARDVSVGLMDEVRSQAEALEALERRPLRQVLAERWMPKPLWAEREAEDDGQDAFRKALSYADADRPYCIYLHMPYCIGKCGYCDCYAFALTKAREAEVHRYLDCLCHEVGIWGQCEALRGRKVSSVHFGGGTPLTMGLEGLSRVLTELRSNFKLDEQTEIAIESTSSILNAEALDQLWQLGVRRLHIGVQSLQDDVRRKIGRRESAEEVLGKLDLALKRGMIISSDVIIGLPDYSTRQVLQDIDVMVEHGIEGFSIYELVHSPRNHGFFQKNGLLQQDIYEKYTQFQLAFLRLQELGFRRNIYNHMAKGRDRNIYFNAPRRSEDLLPLGTIADGYFGDYLIRHAEIAAYMAAVEHGQAGLTCGLLRTEAERKHLRLETEVRSGQPDPQVFVEILGQEKALALFSTWIAGVYIATEADFSSCELTGNGSWFIGKMLRDCLESLNQ